MAFPPSKNGFSNRWPLRPAVGYFFESNTTRFRQTVGLARQLVKISVLRKTCGRRLWLSTCRPATWRKSQVKTDCSFWTTITQNVEIICGETGDFGKSVSTNQAKLSTSHEESRPRWMSIFVGANSDRWLWFTLFTCVSNGRMATWHQKTSQKQGSISIFCTEVVRELVGIAGNIAIPSYGLRITHESR